MKPEELSKYYNHKCLIDRLDGRNQWIGIVHASFMRYCHINWEYMTMKNKVYVEISAHELIELKYGLSD